jgi:2,3-bisphosphoglycerate-dependent phosphoglycerate mutase
MQNFDSPKIWFIRHAESEANVQRIYANGDSAFPLTANGFERARAIARRFSSLAIRSVYTSPILRAMQTAQEICKATKKEMQIAPELSEYNMGIYEGTSSSPGSLGAISDAETKIRWYENGDYNVRSPGGESLNDMKRRFLPFVRRATENCGGDPGILAMVTHGGILTAMLPFVFENLTFDFVHAHPIDHLCIVKGELEGGRLICVEYEGKPQTLAGERDGFSTSSGEADRPGLLDFFI